ncbi:anti-sigma factor [Streptomyces sp. NBC_00059]|uniref:anti-sigma factor n=1 Tax=Streptomyces sp. NBC_00059 TaxID=2975635 RepID=UPI0022574F5A|nr:anti-sigma factor [Streptomyces sp. NBC_00059]MCX5411007.1 anti-sigma factor [Streptomyces sp. NBC_00059]
MITTDPHESSAAYVLHALPEEELREFEAHLADCGACRREVAELRDTVAALGRSTAGTPPDGLRERVLRAVATTPQEHRPRTPGPRTSGRSPARALRMALAASVAVILVCLGLAGWQHREASDARAEAQRAEDSQEHLTRVLTAPDAQLETRQLPDGATASVTFSRVENSAALAVSGLPALPANRTYEAWFMEDGTPVPAGLLTADPGRRLTLLKGSLDDAEAVALTVEPAGGSPQPTTDPLGAIPLPA